ncbi:MAG TPA: metallophosphoesterase [Polyangia bacterium]
MRAASIPRRWYVIGDIHGCALELQLLLRQLDPRGAVFVFVGDYIDRGPQSKEVIETILDLRRRHEVVALMGNHEAMLLDFLRDPTSLAGGLFVYNGGSCTLASYADQFGQYAIPDEHLEFLRHLPLWYEMPGHLVVHAGLPEVPLEQLDPEVHRRDLLWSREMAHSRYRWAKRIIHGHRPAAQLDLRPNQINVDTGCVFHGHLTALELPALRHFSVPLQARAAPAFLRDIRSSRRAVRFAGAVPVRIDVQGHPLHFVTVNYSAVGMFVHCVSRYTIIRLREAEHVRGVIGVPGIHELRFSGEVVRREEREDGVYYALTIASCDPP